MKETTRRIDKREMKEKKKTLVLFSANDNYDYYQIVKRFIVDDVIITTLHGPSLWFFHIIPLIENRQLNCKIPY